MKSQSIEVGRRCGGVLQGTRDNIGSLFSAEFVPLVRAYKLADRHAERFCDLVKAVRSGIALSALDIAIMRSVESAEHGKVFGGQSSLLPELPDSTPQAGKELFLVDRRSHPLTIVK